MRLKVRAPLPGEPVGRFPFRATDLRRVDEASWQPLLRKTVGLSVHLARLRVLDGQIYRHERAGIAPAVADDLACATLLHRRGGLGDEYTVRTTADAGPETDDREMLDAVRERFVLCGGEVWQRTHEPTLRAGPHCVEIVVGLPSDGAVGRHFRLDEADAALEHAGLHGPERRAVAAKLRAIEVLHPEVLRFDSTADEIRRVLWPAVQRAVPRELAARFAAQVRPGDDRTLAARAAEAWHRLLDGLSSEGPAHDSAGLALDYLRLRADLGALTREDPVLVRMRALRPSEEVEALAAPARPGPCATPIDVLDGGKEECDATVAPAGDASGNAAGAPAPIQVDDFGMWSDGLESDAAFEDDLRRPALQEPPRAGRRLSDQLLEILAAEPRSQVDAGFGAELREAATPCLERRASSLSERVLEMLSEETTPEEDRALEAEMRRADDFEAERGGRRLLDAFYDMLATEGERDDPEPDRTDRADVPRGVADQSQPSEAPEQPRLVLWAWSTGGNAYHATRRGDLFHLDGRACTKGEVRRMVPYWTVEMQGGVLDAALYFAAWRPRRCDLFLPPLPDRDIEALVGAMAAAMPGVEGYRMRGSVDLLDAELTPSPEVALGRTRRQFAEALATDFSNLARTAQREVLQAVAGSSDAGLEVAARRVLMEPHCGRLWDLCRLIVAQADAQRMLGRSEAANPPPRGWRRFAAVVRRPVVRAWQKGG